MFMFSFRYIGKYCISIIVFRWILICTLTLWYMYLKSHITIILKMCTMEASLNFVHWRLKFIKHSPLVINAVVIYIVQIIFCLIFTQNIYFLPNLYLLINSLTKLFLKRWILNDTTTVTIHYIHIYGYSLSHMYTLGNYNTVDASWVHFTSTP